MDKTMEAKWEEFLLTGETVAWKMHWKLEAGMHKTSSERLVDPFG